MVPQIPRQLTPISNLKTQLRAVACAPPAQSAAFPFSVPAIATLAALEFTSPVTFFVGENGSGKSTLLEGIACAAELPAVGSQDVRSDATLSSQRRLAGQLRLTWSRRSRRGFFLRAEDFFGFAKSMSQLRSEMLQRLEDVETGMSDASPYARGLAAGPARASLADMERMYGASIDARSHGEAFLKLFESRLAPRGLYLMDEPEAALSPQSQLGLLAIMADVLRNGGQFIVATHSPILLAYPGATIYSFDNPPIRQTRYDELDHVNLTRSFLGDPNRYLRHIVD